MITLLALVPIVGALLVTLLPRASRGQQLLARHVALGASGVALVVALVIAARFDAGEGGYQMVQEHAWIEPLGATYSVGLNGIGLALVLLTVILTPVVLLAAYRDELPGYRSANSYVAWMLVYLISLPIWNFVLPTYAYWKFDDFSWGDTRKTAGEKVKKAGYEYEGEFDSSKITMKRWGDFEQGKMQHYIVHAGPTRLTSF